MNRLGRIKRRDHTQSTAAEQLVIAQEVAAAKATKALNARPAKPGSRGWSGAGAGGVHYLQAPVQWRGTTVQVCGLWPFSAGSGSPMVGVPLGRNMLTGGTLCCDPISWFQRAQLISNPSAFVLGLPGLGKSSMVRRMALGLAGFGVSPMIFGDLKPDYVDLIREMGGQVIELGRGRGGSHCMTCPIDREA